LAEGARAKGVVKYAPFIDKLREMLGPP